MEHVTVRRALPDDLPAVYEYWSDPDVARNYFRGRPWTPESLTALLQARGKVRIGDPGVSLLLAVIGNEEGRVVGDCQIIITRRVSEN
jgi:RimJ/RimL family protein N-acetyltransferase